MQNTLGFIGGGRITAIFLQAWKGRGLDPGRIVVSDPDASVLARLQARFPAIETTPDNALPMAQGIVFLSLHPPVMKSVLPGLGAALRPATTVVSLAPVLTFRKLSDLLNGHRRLVRMIPNAPSLIGAGYNPTAFAAGTSPEDRQRLRDLFRPLGAAPEVEEAQLEAYAVLTAMGPTYFWPQWQALRELGQSFGLPPGAADQALSAMLRGAAELLFSGGMSFDEVMDTIPVKPLADAQDTMTSPLRERLPALHARLTAP
jgi:pyrroline-5-carboxylate reductase